MTSLLRALIVDDEPLVREGLRDALSSAPGVEVVGEARDGPEAVSAVRKLAPDVAFLDVEMPGLNGLEVVRALGPGERPAVVFVTAYDEYAVRAFEVSAVDYLLKPFDEERVRAAVGRVRERLLVSAPPRAYDRIDLLLKQLAERPRYAERFVAGAGGRL